MNREIHFKKMQETSNTVRPLIKKAYMDFISSYPFMSNALKLFVKKRIRSGQLLLRPYLVRLSYEVSKGNKWIDIVPACAALEVFNISTYQSNLAFDGKDGVTTEHLKNEQFISSMVSLNIASKMMLSLSQKFDLQIIIKIVAKLYETNNEIYIGQYYNLDKLIFGNIDMSLAIEDYLKLYLFRCEKLGASLTSLCFEVGALLGGADNILLNNLKNIGKSMGTAGQIVNDIADFIPRNVLNKGIKPYEGSFADFKKGIITYPLFHLLRNTANKEKQLIYNSLNGGKLTTFLQKEIVKMLCQNGSIDSSKELVNSYYKRLKKEVHKIPQSYKRNLLSLSFSTLLTNKYFAILRKYRENQ